MTISRSLVLFLISFLGLTKMNACGGWEDYDTYLSLFHPNYMLPNNTFAPVTFSEEPWSNLETWFSSSAQNGENLRLWKKIMPSSFTEKDINYVVYKSKRDDIRQLLENGSCNEEQLNRVYQTNRKIVNYLLFAKECEQHSNPPMYYWQRNEEEDKTDIHQLIDEGKKAYGSCNDAFLKERYAFQTVKMMRYAEDYNACIEFWDEYTIQPVKKSMIYYWMLDHVAGAELALGKYNQGWKHFMDVFEACPSRRYSAFYSVKIKTDEQWNELYTACNSRQKETQLFIRASRSGSIALEDIQSIYELNPNSAYLSTLVCREINKIESLYLQNNTDDNLFYQKYYNQKDNNEQLTAYLQSLNQFLGTVLSDGKIKDRSFYQLSSAYLSILSLDNNQAKQILANLNKDMNLSYQSQLAILENLLLITDKTKNTLERQNTLKDIYVNDIYDFAFVFFSHPENKLPESLVSGKDMWSVRTQLDTPFLKDLLHCVNHRDELSWFAQTILDRNYMRGEKGQNAAYNKDYYLEMLGTSYLADDDVKNALKCFEQISEGYQNNSESFNLSYNPFNYVVNDVDFDEREVKYSKLKLTQILSKILQLEKDGTASAMDYYLLGNAYYNTTYFGYAWDAKAFYRSGSYFTGVSDCRKAQEYFMKAIDATDDKELKAKCYYLASKANQNLYMTDQSKDGYTWRINWDVKEMITNGYRSEFEVLKNDYADTKFYARIVEECKNFSWYVN
nr:hypothetical protein [uncultured Carboxylicivirga sp.]